MGWQADHRLVWVEMHKRLVAKRGSKCSWSMTHTNKVLEGWS